MTTGRADVAIVGAGVIGLSIAWQLVARGHEVVLIDPHPARGASYVAAGMLAPVTEAVYGEREISELSIRAARAWEPFAADLERASGFDIGYRCEGTLLAAADEGDRATLRDLMAYQHTLGLPSFWESQSAARTREPLLSPEIRGGIWSPDDRQVDNRRLLGALGELVRCSGVHTMAARALSLEVRAGKIAGVRTDQGRVAASTVVVAAGSTAHQVDPTLQRLGLRPVKGQILRLYLPPRRAVLSVTVRGLVRGRSVYIVPRRGGRIIVGATVEEMGPDTSTTAGAVYDLLRDAIRIVPVLSEAHFEEVSTGLRPATKDNAPGVGPIGPDGLIVAIGHYRHGILFAPITAMAVVDIVETGALPLWASPMTPERL